MSAESFARNRESQARMTPLTLERLRELNVSCDRQLKLEYFFYTNTRKKGEGLAAHLGSLGYQVEVTTSASNRKQILVTGWTTPMMMSIEVVTAWTEAMCDAGYANDCEFDGWGTTPAQ